MPRKIDKSKHLDLSKRTKSALVVVLPDGKSYELLDEKTLTPSITMEMARLQDLGNQEDTDDVREVWATMSALIASLIPSAQEDVLAKLTVEDIRKILDFFGSHVQSVAGTGDETSPDSPDSTE